MKIGNNHVVSVSYELRTTDSPDQIVDKADASKPLTFLFGAGQLIPGFEKAIDGMVKGDKFDFTLQPAEAYGERSDERIFDVPKHNFVGNDGTVPEFFKVGEHVMLQDAQGRPMEALILEIGDEMVKLDFNPRMAGKVLNFKGEVVEVRPATPEEIDHGHVHGPGGHHH